MQFFTVDEACLITGMHPQTLRNMISAKLIAPSQPGTTGTGRGHRFSTVQLFALAAGVHYRSQGASADRAAGVACLLAGLPLEYGEAEFDAGRSFPVPALLLGDTPRPDCWKSGMLVEPPEQPA